MILLIEDDDTTRELTAAVLRTAGHDVRTAVNGRAAVVMLEAASGDADVPSVILCDLDMPQLDGWAFRRVQLASERWRLVPFVVVSGAMASDAELELGAAVILRKPVDVEELLACAALFDQTTGLGDRHERRKRVGPIADA